MQEPTAAIGTVVENMKIERGVFICVQSKLALTSPPVVSNVIYTGRINGMAYATRPSSQRWLQPKCGYKESLVKKSLAKARLFL